LKKDNKNQRTAGFGHFKTPEEVQFHETTDKMQLFDLIFSETGVKYQNWFVDFSESCS
jgi:hypothetical protein